MVRIRCVGMQTKWMDVCDLVTRDADGSGHAGCRMQGGSKRSGAGDDTFLQLVVCNYLNNSYTLKSKLVLCYQVEPLVHLLCCHYILPAIMLLYIYYIDQYHNIRCICGVCYVVLRTYGRDVPTYIIYTTCRIVRMLVLLLLLLNP